MEDNQNGRQREFTPVGSKKEAEFLEGPHSRTEEGYFLFNVLKEFIRGFRKLHFAGPCITVFGSARFKEGHQYYEMARTLGGEMANLGFTVMTGGGPGIMEAANRGAKEAGGRSIGCNIILPKEQKPNPYLDRWVDIEFFFVRKVLLTKYSYGFIVMPGGYGTMDEFFESVTLIQTGKILKFPVVLVGKEFHKELYQYLQKLVTQKTIDAADLDLFLFTDSVEETIKHFEKYAIEGFGLKKLKKVKPMGILGESRPHATASDLKQKEAK